MLNKEFGHALVELLEGLKVVRENCCVIAESPGCNGAMVRSFLTEGVPSNFAASLMEVVHDYGEQYGCQRAALFDCFVHFYVRGDAPRDIRFHA